MAPWLRLLETYLVAALLRTPAFHRGVEKVAHRVHRFKNGLPPEAKGGTSVEDASESNFFKHFSEEVQTQLGRAERDAQKRAAIRRKRTVPEGGEDAEAAWRGSVEESAQRVPREAGEGREGLGAGHDAEGAWREAAKRGYADGDGANGGRRGFLGEYMGALRDQVRNWK